MRAVLRQCLVGLLLLCSSLSVADEPIGTLDTVGSDSMAGLMLRWGERLSERYPGIRLQLQASGSASAPAALTAGTTLLGPMSRPMTAEERQAFERRYGYPPLVLQVARDALLMVVNRHSPLRSISRPELDAIFSDDRRCGAERPVRRWSALTGGELQGSISLHGRNAVSGTHELFREKVLCGGSFRPEVNEYPGSAAVVAAVAADPQGIGYAGLNHLSPGVKALALRGKDGRLYAATATTVRQGSYPLTRDLYLYLNLPPGETLPSAERAFVDLVLSPDGQEVVKELGFVALPGVTLERQRARLGLAPLEF